METSFGQSSPANATAGVVRPESAVRTETRDDSRNAVRNGFGPRKSLGYGLPCLQCHLYYPADLDCCPTCNGNERVSANELQTPSISQAVAEVAPDNSLAEQEKLEREREEFLKQFKAQLLEAREEVSHAPSACALGQHHTPGTETATVCRGCYDRLQQRVDVFEAALHIDLKEAAQIVYDAVWADPSEPSKTYANAANALLTELRKRSGVSSVLAPLHPLGN